MNFIPILPIGLLETGYSLNHHDAFILPSLWYIPAYSDFYTSHKFDTVIIDNDVYEKTHCTPLNILEEIADQIDSSTTFVVGHETLHTPSSTLLGFIDELRNSSTKHTPMIVLDGTPSSMKMMYKELKYGLNNRPVIAYSLPVSLYRQGYDRSALYKYIGFQPHNYVHALGIDNIMEIYSLTNACFNSVDSSIITTAAINHVNLSDTFKITRKTPTDYPRVDLEQTYFDPLIVDEVIKNIQLVNSLKYME